MQGMEGISKTETYAYIGIWICALIISIIVFIYGLRVTGLIG